MGSKICSIICGAPCSFDRERVSGYVIAADSGLDRCLSAGITPDLVVGDFDSAKSDVPSGIKSVRVKPEKDDIDTVLASNIAIERGYNELRFFCAVGGRISHTLANIQMLLLLKKRNIDCVLFGENCEIMVLENESVKIPQLRGYLSVFSLGETAVVSAKGVKYSLDKHTLSNDYPLGVSNEISGDFAEITVHSGAAAVVLEDE